AQIDRESAQVRAEGRARLKPFWCLGFEWLVAAGTPTTQQGDARDIRLDLRNLDPVVGVNRLLFDTRDVSVAMLAMRCRDIATMRWVWMQFPGRPGVRLALGFRLPFLVGFLPA